MAYLSSVLKSPATSWSSLIFCLELWFRWCRQLPPHVQEAGKKWCDDLVLVRVAVGWQLGWLSGQKSDHNELGYDIYIYILLGERVFIQYYPWAISWAERSYWFWYVLIAVSDFLGWWPQAWVFLHHAWDSLLSSYQNGAAIDYQYMPQRTNPKPHALPKILACFSVFCFPEQMTVYTVYKVKRINTTVLIFVSWGDVPCKEHILEMNWKGSTHADVVSHVQTPIG